MVPWWCPYDILMRPWWYHDDALIMHWWCTDDALIVFWWCTEYDMMYIGQVSDLHGRFYGGRINGDKTWRRRPTDDDRVNIEQSASGRLEGRVLQYRPMLDLLCLRIDFRQRRKTYCGNPRALQLSFTEPPSGTAWDLVYREIILNTI